jgi:hypothetical protein
LIELLGLILIKSHCDRKLFLYVECLKSLVPRLFALDHHNYSRWIPIHIRDKKTIPASIHNEFEESGNWVVNQTTNLFSGDAIGLTESQSSFRTWVVAGPEQARNMKEVTRECFTKVNEDKTHHEEQMSNQRKFKEHVLNLVQTISELGNPSFKTSMNYSL